MDLFNSWLVQQPIAHRGLHDKATPENSLSAFEKAINAGYAIELDVRIIADGTVIIFHDEALSRLTENDGYVKFLNKADLSLLKLKGTEEHIPTLEDVLTFVNGRVPLLIEIKNNDKVGQLEKAVIETLKDYKGEYAIQSFNPYVLEYFYKHAPHILRGQLAGYFKGEKLSFFKRYALKRMLMNKKISHPDFIAYEAKKLPNIYVRKYKKLPLLAWTVRSQSEYLKVVKHCDNIIFENFEPTI
ncbi:MAG: glycerophosphodiester phosphodiesterase [Clostridiales bacterium]|nr:glycerophosphodiester phosphodiesterase [Clostridiales bacterium]